ncbi:origin recognition complex subunit 4 [Coemansia sp. RSA 552]|nr:origin recognition complex subunit 4 [Coemansia sp. RSA 552]
MDAVRRTLLARLYGRAPVPELVGLDAPLDAVRALLRQTVEQRESNTALVLGPRGSGKSAVVEQALKDTADSAGPGASSFHTVRLSGLVHTSDRTALRDIARQLLVTQDLEHVLIGSVADAFAYILGLLRAAGSEPTPVVFVLDEFDLLAQHPKQALLYALFDAAQARQAPIAVIGVSARIDAMDLLEKRVKSRFSHRQIHVHAASSLGQFAGIARAALNARGLLPDPDARRLAASVDAALATPQVAAHIDCIFDLSKDTRRLLLLFAPAVAHLDAATPLLDPAHILPAAATAALSPKARVLERVSLLELCLLIAMASLTRACRPKYNFEMVYHEYKTFMSRHIMAASAAGAMRIYKKPVALKAFETLVELELVRPVLPSSDAHARNDLLVAAGRAPKEYRLVQLMLEPAQIAELLAARDDVPVVIRRWADQ